jgi:hypothetical protein
MRVLPSAKERGHAELIDEPAVAEEARWPSAVDREAHAGVEVERPVSRGAGQPTVRDPRDGGLP